MQGDTPSPAVASRCALGTAAGCSASPTAPIADQPAYDPANRLKTEWAQYDASGNLLWFKDPIGTGTRQWSAAYDGENKQTLFCNGPADPCTEPNAAAKYHYDADGNRVQKVLSGSTTTYVYDALGQLAAEYSTAGPSGTGGIEFRTTDHLGSTRLVTDESVGRLAEAPSRPS